MCAPGSSAGRTHDRPRRAARRCSTSCRTPDAMPPPDPVNQAHPGYDLALHAPPVRYRTATRSPPRRLTDPSRGEPKSAKTWCGATGGRAGACPARAATRRRRWQRRGQTAPCAQRERADPTNRLEPPATQNERRRRRIDAGGRAAYTDSCPAGGRSAHAPARVAKEPDAPLRRAPTTPGPPVGPAHHLLAPAQAYLSVTASERSADALRRALHARAESCRPSRTDARETSTTSRHRAESSELR